MTSGSHPFEGRHALVTGAGSGIGAAIAKALSGLGASVTLAGRRRQPLEETARACPAMSLVIDNFDVTNKASVAQGLQSARAAFGPVAILVNNAGQAPTAPFEKCDETLVSRVIAVNLTSVFTVTREAISDLKTHGPNGRIVNIASTAGLKGYAYATAYTAAKHGVVGLTRALALELAKAGVTVNAVCPGFTDTPLIDSAIELVAGRTGRSSEQVRAELTRANPQGRLIAPEEVAASVAWLCSDAARSITGQALSISGGEVM